MGNPDGPAVGAAAFPHRKIHVFAPATPWAGSRVLIASPLKPNVSEAIGTGIDAHVDGL
jgi:hypothetical protein